MKPNILKSLISNNMIEKEMAKGNLIFNSQKRKKIREPKFDPEEHNRNAQRLRESKAKSEALRK